MKKNTNKAQTNAMLPEYDLKGKKGVRGKYTKALQKGYSVRILNEDGTITELDEFDALVAGVLGDVVRGARDQVVNDDDVPPFRHQTIR